MDLYMYSGPVSYYDKVIANNWKGETRAETKAQAISNLKYQFKIQSKMAPSAGGITLSGKIRKGETT